MPKFVSPSDARAAAAKGARVIDVRERGEWDAERLEGSVLVPLSGFPRAAESLDKGARLLMLCTAGVRAADAARRLEDAGFKDVSVIAGGLQAWKAAALPVIIGSGRGWPIERQVRLVAGLLVLAGAVGGFMVHPAFFGLSAFVGAGLTFSGLTNWCGMGLLLQRMPWNRSDP